MTSARVFAAPLALALCALAEVSHSAGSSKPAPLPPKVTLTLDAPGRSARWTLRITNEDTDPVRVTADARLARLRLALPGKKTALCALPTSMRADGDTERPLVLPPGRSYSESFDPRLLCFGKADALGTAESVVLEVGFDGKGGAAPWASSALSGKSPRAPQKLLRSEPVPLAKIPSSPDKPPESSAPTQGESPFRSGITLRTPTRIDAYSGAQVMVTLTARNAGERAASFRFSSATVLFEVVGPTGAHVCEMPLSVMPIRDNVVTVAPSREISTPFELHNFCADRVLELPGLYTVRARLDTRRLEGNPPGMSLLFREFVAPEVTLLRIMRAKKVRAPIPPEVDPPRAI